MKMNLTAFWHQASYDRFLNERLPRILAERLPLSSYQVHPLNRTHCRLSIELGSPSATARVEFDLPRPDEKGCFILNGRPCVVVPVASQEALDQAEVACVGEMLYDRIQARLGQPSAELAWDDSLVRALLPLDAWVKDFLNANAQPLDTTNWHSVTTHLRRVLIPNRTRVYDPGQHGRVDPFETPEGSNIGRVFTIATGAEIRDGRIVIVDPSPTGALGHNAILVPFLEHDDANRLLMGVNMMRQAIPYPDPEPAMVQTGFEPAGAENEMWCGRNLLTAFVAWGEASVEDGLIISESCARRLNVPYPAEPGDKLSNRHGVKGVVSQVLPDDQMPHLADGTPVEIVYSFSKLHSRMNFGLIREALMGRIARAEGQPAVVPPFAAPSTEELRARLAKSGLPEAGMERLRAGKDGPELAYPSSAGWVYWYRLVHLAKDKLRVSGPAVSSEPSASVGELTLGVLRDLDARHNAAEALTTRSARWDGSAATAYFAGLRARLAAGGIQCTLEDGQLHLHFAEPQGETLRLVRPLPHPWLAGRVVDAVGAPPAESSPVLRQAWDALAEASQRLARVLSAHAPDRMVQEAQSRAAGCLSEYFDALLPPQALRVDEPQHSSARAVIAPAAGLRLDQIGLPDPLYRILLGVHAAPDSWVLVMREPAFTPTSIVAFHPLPVEGSAVRLHPQACPLLGADFDGDLVSILLPLSDKAQREAGQKLSAAAHLARDPGLAAALVQAHEGVWGLAWRSLAPEGRRQIEEIAGATVRHTPVTEAWLAQAMRGLLERAGPQAAIRAAEDLMRLGYATAKASGASLSPFPAVTLPPQPKTEDLAAWEVYLEAAAEQIFASRDYASPSLGPQLLLAVAKPSTRRHLPLILGPRLVSGPDESPQVIRHGNVQGFRPEELFATIAGARQGLAQLALQGEQILHSGASTGSSAGSLLARARRARHPGIVFAFAAASGETDPFDDLESQLLVGLVK